MHCCRTVLKHIAFSAFKNQANRENDRVLAIEGRVNQVSFRVSVYCVGFNFICRSGLHDLICRSILTVSGTGMPWKALQEPSVDGWTATQCLRSSKGRLFPCWSKGSLITRCCVMNPFPTDNSDFDYG